MSKRVSGFARRSIVAVAAVSALVAVSGCSSLNSRLFGATEATGSVAGPALAANVEQTMPAPLSVQPTSEGRFIPPADIGRNLQAAPVTVASIGGSPVGQGGDNFVKGQNLPPLSSSGSSQAMPAQPSSVPFNVASNTASAPASNAANPRLIVVPDNAYLHEIKSGESLYAIARQYNVSASLLVEANSLPSADKIFVGQKLIIPGKTAAPLTKIAQLPSAISITAPGATVAVSPPVKVAAAEPAALIAPVKPAATDGKFRWPLSGTILTDFAESKSGIDIAAQEGAAVRAAESGLVIYTGSAVQGYGNLVLIKHENGFVSAYAHLKDISVAKGDTVSRGDAVGSAGMTGSVSRPQLHFELRQGATPVDPMPLLAS